MISKKSVSNKKNKLSLIVKVILSCLNRIKELKDSQINLDRGLLLKTMSLWQNLIQITENIFSK